MKATPSCFWPRLFTYWQHIRWEEGKRYRNEKVSLWMKLDQKLKRWRRNKRRKRENQTGETDGWRKQWRKKWSREELLFHFYLWNNKTELLLLHSSLYMFIHEAPASGESPVNVLITLGRVWSAWKHTEILKVAELSQSSNLFLYLKLFNICSHVTWGQPLPLHWNCNLYPPFFFSRTARKLCQTTRIQQLKLNICGEESTQAQKTGWPTGQTTQRLIRDALLVVTDGRGESYTFIKLETCSCKHEHSVQLITKTGSRKQSRDLMILQLISVRHEQTSPNLAT